MVDCFEVPRAGVTQCFPSQRVRSNSSEGWGGGVVWEGAVIWSPVCLLSPVFAALLWRNWVEILPKKWPLDVHMFKVQLKTFYMIFNFKKSWRICGLSCNFKTVYLPPVISWEEACVKETPENSWWSSVPNVIDCERSTFCSNICGTK